MRRSATIFALLILAACKCANAACLSYPGLGITKPICTLPAIPPLQKQAPTYQLRFAPLPSSIPPKIVPAQSALFGLSLVGVGLSLLAGNSEPPRTCPNEEETRLGELVHNTCDSMGACDSSFQTPEEIIRKLFRWHKCVDMRHLIAQRCFGGVLGGDHLKAIKDAQRAIRNCKEELTKATAKPTK